ncbi:MAG: DUF3105 domain-containing protein [Chloroflexota bacterium]|nr:DUF3105 domain-containing protein [Chloroflexota bacterium]
MPETTRGQRAGQERRRQGAAARERARREQRRRWLTIGVGTLIVAIAIVVAAILLIHRRNATPAIAGVESFSGLARTHTSTPVTYPQTPPVGGPHNPVWQNCGYYAAPIANENGVHSLEHGAVWITYRPDLPADQIAALRKLAVGQTYVLITPYPGLPAPVVASAWGKQLKLDSPDDPRLSQFIKAYRQGPQTPEQGSPCTGGTGVPQTT